MSAIRNLLVTACMASGTGLMAVPALAQRGQTSELSGVVTDASHGVLAGATVAIASPQLIGGPQQAATDFEGRYRFPVLLPGIYEVTVAADGFKTVRHSALDLPPGLGITLDFRLELAPLAEIINVEAVAAPIDVRSSAAPSLIDRALIDNLPIAHDDILFRYAALTPGLSENAAVLGVPGFQVPFSLDGTDGTSPQFGIPQARPNANWFQEIQVVSLGASAQYGEFATVRVNGITRSGSNRFSGLSEYWTTRSSWTGSNRGSLPPDFAKRFRPLEVVERWDTSQQVGGPIVRDRLWFFSALEYYKNAERSFGFANVPRSVDEPLTETRTPRYLVKLTGALASGLRLEGYTEYDNLKNLNGNAGPLVRPEALGSGENRNRMQNVRLTWTLSSRTLIEAHFGHLRGYSTSGPTPPGNPAGPPGHYDTLTGVYSVNYLYSFEAQDRVTSASARVTRHIGRMAGQAHELKAGVDYQRDSRSSFDAYTGGMVFLDFGGQPNVVLIGTSAGSRPTFRRTSLFLQDAWRVTGQVTIEPGVRVAFYDTSVPAQGVTFFTSTKVSPRLGVAWDVAANHKTVVRAHYGHYQHPVVGYLFDFLDPGLHTTEITAKVVGPNQFEEITRVSFGPNDRIDPDSKHAYAEEYLAGVERELWSGLALRAQYVRRNFRDALGFVDVGSTWTPVGVVDPGPDGALGTADDGLPMTGYVNNNPQSAARVFTNPPGAYGHYTALQLIATKRYSRGWGLEASYTWSRARSNYNNEKPGYTALSRFGGGYWVNPNSAVFSDGRTNRDLPHSIKMFGTYMFPYWGGVRVSGIYRYETGIPFARRAYFGPLVGFLRTEPIGGLQLEAANAIDLRVEKVFPVRGQISIGAFIDVFNLNNQGIATFVNNMSGPNFLLPGSWSAPRTGRVGVRLVF